MRLVNLKLINFQLHKSTSINLAGGFVCISGDTAAGKTTIVNALNFLFNDVWSDSNIRFGEKSVKVIATLDTGVTVSREKGNGINRIVLNLEDGTEKKFENFGIQAPIEVKKILGVFPLYIDSDYSENINIHMQDDPHFLIKKSAPMKTKFINRITRLHIVDAVNRAVTRDLDTTVRSVQTVNKTRDELIATLNAYGDLSAQKIRLETLCEKIIELTKILEDLGLKADKLYSFATLAADYIKKKTLYERREKIIIRISGIKSLYTTYTKYATMFLAKANLYRKQQYLAARTQYLKAYTSLLGLCQERDSLGTLVSTQARYMNLINAVTDTQKKINLLTTDLPACPTCGRPFEGIKHE